MFRSPESDTGLITFRNAYGEKELLDPTTQQTYPFPEKCPVCNHSDIQNVFSGAEDLTEKLEEQLGIQVERKFKTLAKHSLPKDANPVIAQYQPYHHSITVSTRLFDPEIEYSEFTTVVITQAENLVSSPEYLVSEEVFTQIFRLLFTLQPHQTLILDTASLDIELIKTIMQAQSDPLLAYTEYLVRETARRKNFHMPPETHLILVTSQELKQKNALEKVQQAKQVLSRYTQYGITIIGPYPAKMLRRKNKFSYHLCIQLQRNNQSFPQLRIILIDVIKRLGLQVRLNPKHIF